MSYFAGLTTFWNHVKNAHDYEMALLNHSEVQWLINSDWKAVFCEQVKCYQRDPYFIIYRNHNKTILLIFLALSSSLSLSLHSLRKDKENVCESWSSCYQPKRTILSKYKLKTSQLFLLCVLYANQLCLDDWHWLILSMFWWVESPHYIIIIKVRYDAMVNLLIDWKHYLYIIDPSRLCKKVDGKEW